MRHEQSRRRGAVRFVRVGCVHALAAVIVTSLAAPSLAGHRHRHHSGHVHHRHYDLPAILLGLGVLGIAVHRSGIAHRKHWKRFPRRHHRPVHGVHILTETRYVVPAVPPPAAAIRQPDRPPAGCLMIREYQTRIVVGGREVEAYGDACLQPDGSWRTGPPKLVPP